MGNIRWVAILGGSCRLYYGLLTTLVPQSGHFQRTVWSGRTRSATLYRQLGQWLVILRRQPRGKPVM